MLVSLFASHTIQERSELAEVGFGRPLKFIVQDQSWPSGRLSGWSFAALRKSIILAMGKPYAHFICAYAAQPWFMGDRIDGSHLAGTEIAD